MEKIKVEQNFITLISLIFNDFRKYPSYNIFQNILIIEQFIKDIVENQNNKKQLQDLEYKIQEKIYSFNELNEAIIKGNSQQIILIEINDVPSFSDLSEMCKAELFSLETLKVIHCNIKDISPLIESKFKYIKEINFAVNRIGDENIKALNNLRFSELVELNLFHNDFTNYNFFNFLKNNKSLAKLETLYIGANKFLKNINDEKNEYKLNQIKKIGLSRGVFNINTIYMLKNFVFINLETLYLSNNDLNNISFVNGLELPNIKYIVLNNNFIEDFQNLSKYKKTISNIEIKYNKIKNINCLEDFVDECINLVSISLIGNKINLNDDLNQIIIQKVRNYK